MKNLSVAPLQGRLAPRQQTRLKMLAMDKHSSLLQKFVNYGEKTFYNIGRCPMGYKIWKKVLCYHRDLRLLIEILGTMKYQNDFNPLWVCQIQLMLNPCRGVRKLTGENLKVVWAEFSTLSQAVLLRVQLYDQYKYHRVYSGKLGPGFVLLA